MALALLSGAGAAGATCNELFAKCTELLAPLGGKRYRDMKRLSKALTMLCRDGISCIASRSRLERTSQFVMS
jgi:hypothetical protein